MNMRISKTLPFRILAGIALVMLAGCSTINSRIKENAAVFDSLPADVQEKISQGIVEVGYTPDIVYIAMGNPHEKRSSRSADRNKSTWIYNVYFQDWVGRVQLGYRRVVVYDEKTKRAFTSVAGPTT
jgi:hypothetical protein